MHAKGQTIAFTTLSILFVFLFALVLASDVFFSETPNDFTYDMVESENQRFTKLLTSPGYPSNWPETRPQRYGLLTDDTVDQQKVTEFKNADYEDIQEKHNLRFEFRVELAGTYLNGAPQNTVNNAQTIHTTTRTLVNATGGVEELQVVTAKT